MPLLYRNYYECDDCGEQWEDEWDSTCDDPCPKCEVPYSPMRSENVSAGDYAKCDNCGQCWRDDALDEIDRLVERVSPGEPMPAGQCPDCTSLCHLIEQGDTGVRGDTPSPQQGDTPLPEWLYITHEQDDGCPLDFGTIRARTGPEAFTALKGRMQEIGHEGRVTLRLYRVIGYGPTGVALTGGKTLRKTMMID